jgi:hypothetical protein
MAQMFGVSLRTVENRLAEYNMTNRNRYSDIDNGSLDAHVGRIVSLFPRSGNLYSIAI